MTTLHYQIFEKYIDIKVEWDGFGEKDLMTTDPKLRQAPANGMVTLLKL